MATETETVPALPRRAFCTLFDHRYLPRALVMIDSIRRFNVQHEVWALCLSDEAHQALAALNLPGVCPVSLQQLMDAIPGLVAAKADRLLIEFYYTCMAALHRFVFNSDPDLDATMYVDADIAFFSSPDAVFDQFADAPGAITPHYFPPRLKANERFGLYNAGWSAFRSTPAGMACLDWWLARSLEYSTGIVDEANDRFANQRYLNRFSTIAPGFKVLGRGCNLAPWNIGGRVFGEQNGNILVDGEPLYFFHFHGLKKGMGFFYFDNHRVYGAPLTSFVRQRIYKPYVEKLVEMEKVVAPLIPNLDTRAIGQRGSKFLGIDLKNILRGVRGNALRLADLISGRPIITLGTRVL